MAELAARVEERDDGLVLVSPGVAMMLLTVADGDLITPHKTLGLARQLGREMRLVGPASAPVLQVSERAVGRGWRPVGYGDVLARLTPADVAGDAPVLANREAEELGLPPEALRVPAPVDGQFYQRPAPDEPPFVSEGDVIEPGAVVGLVEVMKFFYEVKFELDGFEGRARVVRCAAADGTAVESGDALIYVVPA